MSKIGWQRAKLKSTKKEQGFTFLDLGLDFYIWHIRKSLELHGWLIHARQIQWSQLVLTITKDDRNKNQNEIFVEMEMEIEMY